METGGLSSHDAQPVKDSWYTQYGLKADLWNPHDYPLEAVCSTCGGPIRCEDQYSDWQHFQRD